MTLPRVPYTDDDLIAAVASGGMNGVTRNQIAKFVARTVHPLLIQRIERLVERGIFERGVFELANGARGYRYYYNTETEYGMSN